MSKRTMSGTDLVFTTSPSRSWFALIHLIDSVGYELHIGIGPVTILIDVANPQADG